MIHWNYLAAPWGRITVRVDGRGKLVGIDVRGEPGDGAPAASACRPAIQQLDEYFAGRRRSFALPLALTGTEFQRRVWTALSEIQYGEIISYGDLARRIGQPRAARAVGAANGANPIPIVIPCHRVIATGGALGGYSGGLEVKRALLDLEGQRLAA